MHPLIGVGNININFWCYIPIWKGYSCNPFFHSGNKKNVAVYSGIATF